MADPACKDCKFFEPHIRGETGECMDPTKRIYPRRAAASEVPRPETHAEFTCRNWGARDTGNGGKA